MHKQLREQVTQAYLYPQAARNVRLQNAFAFRLVWRIRLFSATGKEAGGQGVQVFFENTGKVRKIFVAAGSGCF